MTRGEADRKFDAAYEIFLKSASKTMSAQAAVKQLIEEVDEDVSDVSDVSDGSEKEMVKRKKTTSRTILNHLQFEI